MSTVIREVSERKTAEEFNSVLLEYSPNPIKVCYPDLSIAYINPALEKITGYSREELIGKKPPYPYWGKKDTEQYEKDMLQHLYLDANILERRLYRKDGEPFLVETNVSLVKQGETLKFFIFNWTDITARKRVENELTQQNILLTSLVNSPSDILIFAMDKNYCYTTFNDLHRQEMLRGWNVDIKIGMNFLSLITIPELHRKTQQSLERALKGEVIKETHYQPAKNVYYEFIWNPIKQTNGTIVGITCFGRDITERHLASIKINLLNERLTVATQAASIGVTDTDIKQHTITWDHRMFEIYGIPYEFPLPHEKWAQAVHPEDLPVTEASANNVIRNKSCDSIEFRIFRPDGSMRYINGMLKAVVDENNEAVRLVGVNIDITEKKLAEAALKESEGFNASLLHDSPNPILVNNLEGFVTYANQAVINLTGFSREEIVGSKAPHSWWPIEKWNEYEVKDVKNHRPVTFNQERYYQKKNGEKFWVVINMRNIFENGKIKYYISNWVDITERKQAEEKLRLAAQEWRTTFDSITDMVCIRDREGKIIRMNRAFANRLNKQLTELIDSPCCQVVHGRKESPSNCPYQKVLTTKKPSSTEYFEPSLGIYIQESISPILDETGEISGSVNILRDMTEHKRLEEQLMLTDRLATIGELAAGVAHELNNPLTSVIGFSQLILEGEIPSEIKGDLTVINSEAQRAAKIVRNLLTFGRNHKPVKQLNQINECINEVLGLRAYEHKCRNIKVINQLDTGLPKIFFDYFQMQQVFINLIINAEFFMIQAHNGGILTLSNQQSDGLIRISVSDDGPGITEETLKRLFNPFFTTKEIGQGTGLGLAIYHGIVSEHGGNIYARSEFGKGATFVVELPIKDK